MLNSDFSEALWMVQFVGENLLAQLEDVATLDLSPQQRHLVERVQVAFLELTEGNEDASAYKLVEGRCVRPGGFLVQNRAVSSLLAS